MSRIHVFASFLLMILTLAACDGGGTGSSGGSASGPSAFIITTDWQTGSYSVVNADTMTSVNSIGNISSDAVAVYYGGLVYVINRLGQDNIQVIDPANGYGAVRQFSTGAGSNPHDIAFAGANKAYISRYGSAELLIVNPATGAELGTIDLSAFADDDGIPEMSALYIKNGRLYVAIQALYLWSPSGRSAVAVIDTSTDEVITSIQLPYQNPMTDFIERSDGKLAMGCVGSYGAQDGGLAIVDPAGETAQGSAITEAFLGGDIGAVALVSDNSGFAVISDASFNTILKRFDAGAASEVYRTADYTNGIAVHGSQLWFADRTATNPGIRIFDAATGGQVTADPVDVGLPPSQIVFID